MKYLIQKFLWILAAQTLRRYRPRIVAITGSIGKTSTKEAIATALQGSWLVRATYKNYNNELGVPLTILGERSGFSQPLAWLGVCWRAWWLAFGPKQSGYPAVLVVEMGADHPGDIQKLVWLACPHIGVVTGVGPVHLEFFQKIEKVAEEKSQIIQHILSDGWAILNGDDDLVVPMREKTSAKILTYGFGEKNDVRIHDVIMSTDIDPTRPETVGLRCKVSYEGSVWPVSVPGLLGRHQLYPVAASLAVGLALGLNAVTLSERLAKYRSPVGRMNVVAGIKGSLLIDDSYNSSPTAALAALDTLQELSIPGKKYAVLGDMAELGSYTEVGHQEVGESVVTKAEYLVTVGERAKIIAATARESGFDEDRVYSFDSAEEAGRFLQERLQTGDGVLIKGSQSVRLEKVVKEIMAEPERASELLVRQGSEWQSS